VSLGLDLSDRRPQRLTRELAEQANVVVTMVRRSVSVLPGKRYPDWDLQDPKDPRQLHPRTSLGRPSEIKTPPNACGARASLLVDH
jgi:protein-tyrosine-phosphatase